MTYLLVLLALAVLLSAETIRLMITGGGGGSMCPPRSHFTDPRFRSPLAR